MGRAKKTQVKKTGARLQEEDPAEEDHIFRPADSRHFRNGAETDSDSYSA